MNDPGVPAARAKWPVYAAGLLNLVPIVGVILWGWSAFALIFLYWLENVVIGGRTALSMLTTAAFGKAPLALALFFAGFFTVHYGIFCLGHGMFVVSMFGGEADAGASSDLFGAATSVFKREPGLVAGLASIVLWQIVQFVLFLARGEPSRVTPMSLMVAPYPRIIVLHLTILFGGFLLLWLNQPLAGLILLALIKAAFDVAEASGGGFGAELQKRVEARLNRDYGGADPSA